MGDWPERTATWIWTHVRRVFIISVALALVTSKAQVLPSAVPGATARITNTVSAAYGSQVTYYTNEVTWVLQNDNGTFGAFNSTNKTEIIRQTTNGVRFSVTNTYK